MQRSHPLLRQDMFEVKPPAMAKKESSTETDEGLGSSGKRCGSGSFGSVSAGSGASLYLSDSQDWVISPSCSPDEPPAHHHHHALSPMLAEETFRYMTYLALEPSPYSHPGSKVLSGDRVEQMAKTYNDIEVVTHLLVERDRDLELAARIGQSLLQRNNLLQERNEAVEEQLAQALDQVNQLQHELAKKDELLRMVASASEESETDSSCSTPHRQPPHHHHHHGGTSAATALSQLEALQYKLQDMEEENLALRSEACHLKTETISYEEKEQQLVSDCVKELRESNSQMVALTDELSKKNQDLHQHQEEIAQLLSQIVDLQHRVKELALEKEELRIHLQASKEAQRQLTAELNELAERNAECVGMLHESQEEIKELRNKNTPSAGMRRHLSYGLYPMDSLAAEIEGTMRRELSVEEETSVQEQRDALEPLRISQKRVFQTVRAVKTSAAVRASSAVPPIPGSGGRSSLVMTAQPFTSNQGEETKLGQPGSPGRNDLTEALHRLSLRRHNFLCEQQFFLTERERKLQAMAGEAEPPDASGCGSTPMGSRLSSYSNLSELSLSSAIFKTFLPEKLQIVKPMEGSLTLHHWQQLAKPHLGTILDPHPGVVTKGFRPLAQDADSRQYRLTDLEEDEEDNDDKSRGRRDEKSRGRRDGPQEKGSAEANAEEDEEEEGGITFKARCSSTPEEKERKNPAPPLCFPALWGGSPITTTSSSSSSSPRPDLSLDFGGSDVIGASPYPPARSISTSPTAPVQSQSCFTTAMTTTTTTTTTAPTGSSSVQNPGKCQSSTFSTYTFTTCRILHPSDITQVTSSSHPQSSSSVQLANTPSSMRTGPSTPVTPCRLSLGDCFPPSLRRAPTAAPPPGGLAKLVLEKGISAQVSRGSLPVPTDNFLASRPAELFLQDVYGLNLGRAPTHPDLPSPSADREDGASSRMPEAPRSRARADSSGPPVGLMERLCRLGFSKVLQSEPPPPQHRRHDSSTFVVAAGGGSLLDGLRRNQSLPAMIGGTTARGGGTALLPPPPHPTSLALPPPPWGDLNDRRRRPASVSQPPGSGKKTDERPNYGN